MIYTFFIKDLYDTTAIVEPKGWKDLMSELDRQFDTHGVFFSYAGGGDKAGTVFKLAFSCDAKTLLEAAYQGKGTEAFYQFGVNEAANEFVTPTQIFLGEIDFETRGFDEDFFKAEINQISNIVKLKNRSDIKIGLNVQQSLDGDALARINFDESIRSLATKPYRQLIISEPVLTYDSVQSVAVSSPTYLYGIFGFTDVTKGELGKYKPDSTRLDDSVINSSFLTVDRDVSIAINFDIDVDIDVTEDQGSGTTVYLAGIHLYFDKAVKNFLGNEINDTSIISDNDAGPSPYDTTLSLTFINGTKYFIMKAGTSVRIELSIKQTTTGTAQFTAVLDVIKFDITITDKQAQFSTRNKWYNIHDALQKNVSAMTNVSDLLYSELLGNQLRGYAANGCLSTLFVTNGNRIRQIDDDQKAPRFTFKDFIKNINVINPIGYGIEEIESNSVLGTYDIYWIDQSSGIGEFRIYENVTYSIYIGDTIGFYNSEGLYGNYDVTNVVWSGLGYTTIYIDISTNDQYSALIIEEGSIDFGEPKPNTWYNDVYVTGNSTTQIRERLRVESWTHFYGETELIDLGIVQDYSEEPFNEEIFNSIKIGFNKYADDEDKPSTIEEFETISEWSLPLQKIKKSKQLIMSWIGSTFLFNESRERIYAKKLTTSHKLDNNIFFCEKVLRTTLATVDFSATNSSISMSADAYENYVQGMIFFIITGATIAANNKSYKEDVEKEAFLNIELDKYTVYLSVTPDTDDADDTVTIDATGTTRQYYKPESNENILTSSGLTRPNYFMNQRRTIKRFLLAWGSYIKSTLSYLLSAKSTTIQNLYYDGNGAFTTEIDSYDLDTDCITAYGSIQEDANISYDDLGAAKFKPNLISCTVKICDTDYQMILDAHKNKLQSPDDVKNYGYFSIESPKGIAVSGWLMNMKRSPVNRIAKLTLLERA